MINSEKLYAVLATLSLVALTMVLLWILRPQYQNNITPYTSYPEQTQQNHGTIYPNDPIQKQPVSNPAIQAQEKIISVSGKVTDTFDNPINLVKVSILLSRKAITSSLTDAEGIYKIPELPSGTYDIIAEHAEYAKGGKKRIQIRNNDETLSINIILEKGVTFRGKAVSTEKEAVENARIRIYGPVQTKLHPQNIEEQIWRETKTALTDSEGRFQLTSLFPGEYQVIVSHKEYLPADRSTITIEPTMDTEIEFLLEMGGKVSGTITDLNTDKQIEKAQVFLLSPENTIVHSRRTLTDENGKYCLTGLRTGTINLRVIARGYLTETRNEIDIVQGKETAGIDFALSRGTFISGVVVSEDGAPIEEASVTGTDKFSYANVKTDKEGKFKLEGFSDKPISIGARAKGYALLVQREITPNTGNITIVLKKAGTISGRVIAEEALPEFVVAIYTSTPEIAHKLVAQAITRDPQGNFTVNNVSPGVYSIEAHIDGFTQTNNREVIVSGGEDITGIEIFVEK
ncbi:MAG: carboxypeptidase-like regulatory domain-containing protein [Planctomycetota bacterium]